MKYIDAEKLKAEIERRKLQNRYMDTDGYEQELFEIIDSLQQEQQEEPDKSLEEAAKEYAEGPECTWVGTTALEEAFKAGAKWMEEEINKELIKAAEKVHEIRDADYDIHVDTAAYGSFEITSFYKNGKLVGQELSNKEV